MNRKSYWGFISVPLIPCSGNSGYSNGEFLTFSKANPNIN